MYTVMPQTESTQKSRADVMDYVARTHTSTKMKEIRQSLINLQINPHKESRLLYHTSTTDKI